jgi:hypothetical protein
MSTLADEFATVFRHEHRQVRDVLLELIDAFQAREHRRIGPLLERTAALTGPHFRYEEEALYPALGAVFEDAYVGDLYRAHDGAIARARELVDLAQRRELSEADVSRAVHMIREILPHVSDCDGLSVMVEVLPERQVQSILEARERAGKAGLDLLSWADTLREPPVSTRV